MAREKSPDYGVLQEFIDRLFDGREDYMRLEVVLEGEAYGLNGELMEVLNLLPPGLYTRDRLCGQINSSLSSHGWGYVYLSLIHIFFFLFHSPNGRQAARTGNRCVLERRNVLGRNGSRGRYQHGSHLPHHGRIVIEHAFHQSTVRRNALVLSLIHI